MGGGEKEGGSKGGVERLDDLGDLRRGGWKFYGIRTTYNIFICFLLYCNVFFHCIVLFWWHKPRRVSKSNLTKAL